jgi:hypothetical protein
MKRVEFDILWKERKEQLDTNGGSGLFGRMAWEALHRNELIEELIAKGEVPHSVVHDETN